MKLNQDIISEHIKRTNLPVSVNDELIYQYCTHCGLVLDFNLKKIVVCNKCTNIYYKYVTDNHITDMYKRTPYTLSLCLTVSWSCLQSKRNKSLLDLMPKYFNLSTVLICQDQEKLYNILNGANDDLQLFQILGENEYSIIKYLILNRNFNIVPIDFDENTTNSTENTDNTNVINLNGNLGGLLKNNKHNKYDNRIQTKHEAVHDSATNNNKFIGNSKYISDQTYLFKVNYNYDITCNFDRENPQYLFHGSPVYNWYSILQNGLKNLSGTHLMANGKAYGNGIYFSNNVNMSLSYGQSRELAYNYSFIGVFQILDDVKKYQQTTSDIFVIANDSILLLKYLIISKKQHLYNLSLKYFDDMYIENSVKMSKLYAKRLQNDITKLKIELSKNNCVLENTDSIFKYYIITEFDTYVLIFPQDYPNSSPVFNKHSQDDDDTHYKIILPEFTPNYWKVSHRVHEIISKYIQNPIYFDISTKDYCNFLMKI